jgi:hypothetical protein
MSDDCQRLRCPTNNYSVAFRVVACAVRPAPFRSTAGPSGMVLQPVRSRATKTVPPAAMFRMFSASQWHPPATRHTAISPSGFAPPLKQRELDA